MQQSKLQPGSPLPSPGRHSADSSFKHPIELSNTMITRLLGVILIPCQKLMNAADSLSRHLTHTVQPPEWSSAQSRLGVEVSPVLSSVYDLFTGQPGH
jgi:hypothetical protein